MTKFNFTNYNNITILIFLIYALNKQFIYNLIYYLMDKQVIINSNLFTCNIFYSMLSIIVH